LCILLLAWLFVIARAKIIIRKQNVRKPIGDAVLPHLIILNGKERKQDLAL
jgi:hypothetical protein